MDNYILELRGVSKTFPGVRALDNVRFDLRPGEIHSIMGENGAGKSTFIKIITGVYIPDEGEMLFNGKPVTIQGTNDSQKLGIAAIYQHVTSYPDLSVTENIFIGHEIISKRTKRLLWNQMHAKAKDLLEQLGASFDPKIRMGTLSVASFLLILMFISAIVGVALLLVKRAILLLDWIVLLTGIGSGVLAYLMVRGKGAIVRSIVDGSLDVGAYFIITGWAISAVALTVASLLNPRE